MYRGQSAHLLKAPKVERVESHRPWWQSQIALFFMFIGVMALVGWAAVSFLQMPYAHYSVSKQKIVAVYTADGHSLPLKPLPDRYELINVQ